MTECLPMSQAANLRERIRKTALSVRDGFRARSCKTAQVQRSTKPGDGLTLAAFDLAVSKRLAFCEARKQLEQSAGANGAEQEVRSGLAPNSAMEVRKTDENEQQNNPGHRARNKENNMPKDKTKDRVVRVLEMVIEVAGVVLMIVPFFQSRGRRKTR